MIASAVEVGKIGDVVLASLVAGIGVTVLFSLGILGLTRFSDLRRDGQANGLALVLHAALAAVGIAGSLAAVVYGFVLLSS